MNSSGNENLSVREIDKINRIVCNGRILGYTVARYSICNTISNIDQNQFSLLLTISATKVCMLIVYRYIRKLPPFNPYNFSLNFLIKV